MQYKLRLSPCISCWDLWCCACSICEHKLSKREKHKVLRDIACALDDMAERGWAHLDLKPANIMLTRDYKVKVCPPAYTFTGNP